MGSEWAGGFQGEIAVRNGSAAASSAWTVTFTFANGQQVSQSWNTTLTQAGAVVTARNVSYNGALAAGARGDTARKGGAAGARPGQANAGARAGGSNP